MTEQEWEDKLDEVQKHSENWYNKYKQAEEKIAELEKENAELKADNDARKFAMTMSEKVEKQLREQIEKMKCCGNCKYGYCSISSVIEKDGKSLLHCWNIDKRAYCDCGNLEGEKYQLWEIKEND